MAPTRIIEGQITKLSRTMHGIYYDAPHDEMFVPVALAGAVLVFRGAANGMEPPIRILQGEKTQIVRPDTLSVDLKHDELIVASGEDSILVFPRTASGDVAPSRAIEGPKTGLTFLLSLAVDPVRNLIFATSRMAQGSAEVADNVLVFDREAKGDVAPRALIGGPHTGILKVRQLEVDAERGLLFAAVSNNIVVYRANDPLPSQWDAARAGFIGVWRVTDNGDVAPKAVVRGPAAGTVWPVGLAINPAAGEVYYVDMVRNGLFTFALPELFKRQISSATGH